MREYLANSDATRHPAADLCRRTLARIPTVFGKLAYVAGLRDAAGGYRHPALTQTLGSESADRMLRHSHHQIFAEWLSLSLEEQKGDLDEFLRASPAAHEALRYRELAPSGAREVEWQLYITDLETLLELLKNEHDAAGREPGA